MNLMCSYSVNSICVRKFLESECWQYSHKNKSPFLALSPYITHLLQFTYFLLDVFQERKCSTTRLHLCSKQTFVLFICSNLFLSVAFRPLSGVFFLSYCLQWIRVHHRSRTCTLNRFSDHVCCITVGSARAARLWWLEPLILRYIVDQIHLTGFQSWKWLFRLLLMHCLYCIQLQQLSIFERILESLYWSAHI